MGLRSSAVSTQLTRLRFSIILSISISQLYRTVEPLPCVLGFECPETFLALQPSKEAPISMDISMSLAVALFSSVDLMTLSLIIGPPKRLRLHTFVQCKGANVLH